MDFDYIDFLSSALKEKALVDLVHHYAFYKPWWDNVATLYSGEQFRLNKEMTLTFRGMGGTKSIKTDRFFILWLDYGIGDYVCQRCVLVKPEYHIYDLFYDKRGDEWVKFRYEDVYFYFKIEYDFKFDDVSDELTKFLFKIKPYLRQADISPEYRNLTYKQYIEEDGNCCWYEGDSFTRFQIIYIEDLINTIDTQHIYIMDKRKM